MMEYWQERQEAMYKAGEMKVNQYFTRLEKAFNQTRRELQKTIEGFYFRYAEENGLSFAAAQKKLDAEELGELQDFIDLAMQNIGRYNQQVNNMSIKARVTRYQALEAQVDVILRQLYAIDYEVEAEKTMQEVYEDAYYRTWYNVDQYHGFHAEFAQINPEAVQTLLEYPFNGAAFSSRLWKQKDHLQAQLMENVTTMLIQGKHPSTLTKDFAKKMNSKKFDAYRLLHTESSFLMSEATHAGYKEDGVPKYEILATLDSKTCGVCGDLDNEVYEVGKEVTGVNKPPFHPLCRCTTVPHYDDTPTEGLTRVARDADWNSIEVPADMTYSEWKKVVDEGGDFASWKKPEKPNDSENRKRYAARREEGKRQAQVDGLFEAKKTAVMLGISEDKVEFDEIDAKSRKSVYNGINKVFKKFPQLKGFTKSIRYTPDLDAIAASKSLSGEVILSADFKDYEGLKKKYDQAVKLKEFPKGTTVDSVIVHEMGHQLDGFLTIKGICGGQIGIYGTIRTSVAVEKEVLKELGYYEYIREERTMWRNMGYKGRELNDALAFSRKEFITAHISGYANENSNEFFAECFSEYMTSKTPRKAAKIFGKVLERAIGELE